MNEHQKKVLEFHKLFNLGVGESPRFPSAKEVELRKNLINEEAKEFCDWSDAGDIVGVADAIADLLYVVYGAALTYGIDIEPVFAEVQRSNLSKAWDEDDVKAISPSMDLKATEAGDGKYVVIRKSDGKVIKSPKYSRADIKGVLEKLSQ